MKNRFAASLPCGLVYAAAFWLLPLCARETGLAILLMLAVLPLICFFTALLHGLRRGLSLWPAVWAALLFAPTIWVHYNESAAVYLPVYALLALIGTGAGAGLRRAHHRKDENNHVS